MVNVGTYSIHGADRIGKLKIVLDFTYQTRGDKETMVAFKL